MIKCLNRSEHRDIDKEKRERERERARERERERERDRETERQREMRVNLLTDYKNNNQKRFEMSKRLYVFDRNGSKC